MSPALKDEQNWGMPLCLCPPRNDSVMTIPVIVLLGWWSEFTLTVNCTMLCLIHIPWNCKEWLQTEHVSNISASSYVLITLLKLHLTWLFRNLIGKFATNKPHAWSHFKWTYIQEDRGRHYIIFTVFLQSTYISLSFLYIVKVRGEHVLVSVDCYNKILSRLNDLSECNLLLIVSEAENPRSRCYFGQVFGETIFQAERAGIQPCSQREVERSKKMPPSRTYKSSYLLLRVLLPNTNHIWSLEGKKHSVYNTIILNNK